MLVLTGQWRAAIADDDLRRTGIGLDLDDSSWEPVTVPGHWRSVPAFADSNGPLLYRTRFDQALPERDERRWVVLDGIFYQGDVCKLTDDILVRLDLFVACLLVWGGGGRRRRGQMRRGGGCIPRPLGPFSMPGRLLTLAASIGAPGSVAVAGAAPDDFCRRAPRVQPHL